ncbi:DUF4145 domain-containing protein [Pseudomonas frederiksbergensis]
MNRKLWRQSFEKSELPAWTCPVCRVGHTEIAPATFAFNETYKSKKDQGHNDWDPDWIEYIFTAWAKCSNKKCEQDFALSGTGGVELVQIDYDEQDWQDYFIPKSCIPMPEIFEIPLKCPKNIRVELTEAFSLFWAHRESCAGRIRVALELLMTHIGVPSQKETKAGKLVDMKLHERLENFGVSNPTIGSYLMALKLLGNSGSHVGEVSHNDLLDAFDILEQAIDEIINQRSQRAAEMVKKLTLKHGKA